MTEEDKGLPIPGFKDYSITRDGRVWSSKRNRWLKAAMTTRFGGYCSVSLPVGGKHKLQRVHRLVALTYLDNPDSHPIVNHKNGIKEDNRVENLEWCSYRENSLHAFEAGLMKRGQYHGNAVLNEEDVIFIRENYRAYSSSFGATALGKRFGVGAATISAVVRGRIWRSFREDDIKPISEMSRRLSDSDIDFILDSYKLRDPNFGIKALSERFRVDPKTIRKIIKTRSRRHINV